MSELKPSMFNPLGEDVIAAIDDRHTAETHRVIDARRLALAWRLALMTPTAMIINVAQGALIDEGALAEALVNGRLGGAGLDAFAQEPPDLSSPLFNLPSVITTPYISGQRMVSHVNGRAAQLIMSNV